MDQNLKLCLKWGPEIFGCSKYSGKTLEKPEWVWVRNLFKSDIMEFNFPLKRNIWSRIVIFLGQNLKVFNGVLKQFWCWNLSGNTLGKSKWFGSEICQSLPLMDLYFQLKRDILSEAKISKMFLNGSWNLLVLKVFWKYSGKIKMTTFRIAKHIKWPLNCFHVSQINVAVFVKSMSQFARVIYKIWLLQGRRKKSFTENTNPMK